MGIDFGRKRVGIALSDEEQKIAFPKIVYPTDKKLVEPNCEILQGKFGGLGLCSESQKILRVKIIG